MFRSKLAFIRETTMSRLVLVASIVLSAFLINVSGHSGVWKATKQEMNSSSSTAPARGDQRLEVEVITITAGGFEPQEIARPSGPFILSVTNRSGADSLTVRIETEQRGKFREKLLTLRSPYWREVINPPPGKYIITEVNHPDWMLSFIIQ